MYSHATDGRDPEATIHRLGIRAADGAALVVFNQGEIDHPSVGFTQDGSAIVGELASRSASRTATRSWCCLLHAFRLPRRELREVDLVEGRLEL